MNNVIDPARLTTDLGGKWFGHYGTAPCPCCQLERRKDQNALGVTSNEGQLLLNCKKLGCDFRDILTACGLVDGTFQIDQMALENAKAERIAQAKRSKERARSIWDQGQSIDATKGEAYLRARGVTAPLPESLRWVPDIYHQPSGSYCSAMVADVTAGGVHRTFFTKQGERLHKSAKMMLGPCAGGHVRLSDDVGPLVVCEGIETGLSLLSGLLSGPVSVWACLSTSGLTGVSLPSKAGKLIIATDGDEAGKVAGDRLAMRASALGWQVSLLPAPNGRDWNDVLIGGVLA